MSDAASAPTTVIDERLAAAWRGHLGQELEAHRGLLAASEAKTRALVENDFERLRGLLADERERSGVLAQMRLRRERLRALTARELACDSEAVRIAALVEHAPESHRAPLRELERQIREVADRLRRVTERNLMLLRSGLSVVDEVLAVVTGVRLEPGYGPVGRRAGGGSRAGGLCSFEA